MLGTDLWSTALEIGSCKWNIKLVWNTNQGSQANDASFCFPVCQISSKLKYDRLHTENSSKVKVLIGSRQNITKSPVGWGCLIANTDSVKIASNSKMAWVANIKIKVCVCVCVSVKSLLFGHFSSSIIAILPYPSSWKIWAVQWHTSSLDLPTIYNV